MLPIFLPCAAGVEELLAEEVQRVLPNSHLYTARGGVSLEGGPLEVMTLNLQCRLTQRVLVEVAEGPYQNEQDVYELAMGVDWAQWITPEHTLRVDTTAKA
jgi:putative N6-adenine-specific DNA methylase